MRQPSLTINNGTGFISLFFIILRLLLLVLTAAYYILDSLPFQLLVSPRLLWTGLIRHRPSSTLTDFPCFICTPGFLSFWRHRQTFGNASDRLHIMTESPEVDFSVSATFCPFSLISTIGIWSDNNLVNLRRASPTPWPTYISRTPIRAIQRAVDPILQSLHTASKRMKSESSLS